MKRSKFLCAAIFALVLFLLCQFYVSKKLLAQQDKQTGSTEQKILESLKLWNRKFEYSLILFDPEILAELVKGAAGSSTSCKYLCQKRPITFALESEFIVSKDAFASRLTLIYPGSDVRCEEGRTTWSHDVITQCIVSFSWRCIRIIVLYERPGGFYWFRAENNSVPIGNSARALDKFDTQRIQIDGVNLRIPSNILSFLHDWNESHFIECNTTRAELFYAQYGKDTGQEALVFKDKGIHLIQQAKTALDELNLPFWLSSGTCLGWFRQCGIIPYSKDVDLGIFIQNYNPALISTLQRKGLNLKHKFGLVSDSLELSFVQGDIKLDIFFFYEENDYTWNGGTQAKTGNKYKYIFKPFSLCWTEFFSLKVRIPCDAESYIAANYGPSWFIPVKEWDWKQSPPNVQNNGQWDASQMEEAVQIFE